MNKKIVKVIMASLVVLALAALPLAMACAEKAPAPATTPAPATSPKPTTPVATPAEKEIIKWRMQNYVPGTVDSYQILGPDFCDLVRVMSNGRLDITPYAAGELVKNTEIMDAVGKGVVECGVGLGAYWSGKIPVAKMVYGLPYTFQNRAELQTFLVKTDFLSIVRRAYADNNVYFVGPAIDNGFTQLSKKPVNSVDDLKEMKLRAPGAVANLLEGLGASMVSLSGTELYTALATGVIDGCTYGGFKTQWQLGNHEVTEYIMWPKIMPVHMPWELLVKADSWNALDDDLKAIVNAAWIQQENVNFANKYTGDIEYLVKMQDYGLKVVTLSDDDQAKMREAAQKVLADTAALDAYCAEATKVMEDFLKSLGR